MNYIKLKKRIKKNEGYSKTPYKDKLGFYTIGYGHMIKFNENKYYENKYKKKYLTDLFEKDFAKCVFDYNKFFSKEKHNKKEKDLLVEMIYQMGINRVLLFKKMLKFLKMKKKYMVCLEMMNSLWYNQTPRRVENLIKFYLTK